MKKEDKINLLEETKFIINRYDFFYETINSKSNFYMAINTLIIGGIMTGYPILNKQYQFKGIMEYIPIIVLLLNLAALIFTVLAIKPFLSKKGCSLLFFNNVANRHQEEYLNLLQHVTKKEMLKDSATQVHELACGLRNKFQKINCVTFLTSLQLILIMLFTIILIIKY